MNTTLTAGIVFGCLVGAVLWWWITPEEGGEPGVEIVVQPSTPAQ